VGKKGEACSSLRIGWDGDGTGWPSGSRSDRFIAHWRVEPVGAAGSIFFWVGKKKSFTYMGEEVLESGAVAASV
jgi:hypothetical protein